MSESNQKRARTACGPCHRRKRKCDGLEPCGTCDRDGYQCHRRNENKVHNAAPVSPGSIAVSNISAAHDGIRQRSRMTNSGPLFVRQLLTKISPANPPQKQLSAWNIGSRPSLRTNSFVSTSGITDLLTHAQLTALAYVYFEKVDPCYGFIERKRIFQQINHRWSLPESNQSGDAVLCGVAAIGSYFSKALAVPIEAQLVHLAKSMLDSMSLSAPDPDIMTAWICYVFYLRLTSAPLTAWIASCTTMHMLEAAGLDLDVRSDETVLAQPSSSHSPEILRRAFGVAQHLNTWISYDLGLSRVVLGGPSLPLEPSDDGNYTDKLLELLPISLGLDRVANQDDDHLLSSLASLVAKGDSQPPLIMAQCNLTLCILRQLCARDLLRTNEGQALKAALNFLARGLGAARQMIEDDCPWHHLANVPFQTLCMLLAIDTPASLGMVSDAMQTLHEVTKAYNTVTLREAYSTAYLVLFLHHKRRLDDAHTIDAVLSKLPSTEYMALDPQQDVIDLATPTDTEIAWINRLMGEFPSLQTFGFNDILSDCLDDGHG